jgi:uncharacterized protein YkwD
MQKLFFLSWIAFFSISLSFGQTTPANRAVPKPKSSPSTAVTPKSIEVEVFNLVNNYRASANLSVLKREWELDAIALEHSQKIASGEIGYSHDGFGDRVKNIKKYAYVPYKVNENLYEFKPLDPKTVAKTALKGWIDSPGHKKNMERQGHLFTGVGVAISPNGTYYVTQIFVGKLPEADVKLHNAEVAAQKAKDKPKAKSIRRK